ncbi:MAG: CotH kinase family protein [Defluviitaleaceae bacterium]|nr:CotH kinase family protein [Defluviitaleaceae bacterium]
MKRILVLILAVAVLIVTVVFMHSSPAALVTPETINDEVTEAAEERENEPLIVYLSEEGHFFPQGVSVQILTNNPDAVIHYTLDGALPTTYSAVFANPIDFTLSSRPDVAVVRAIAVYDEETTEPITHTFFLNAGIDDRFDVLVFSLSTDHDNLYCFYEGILVNGVVRRDFLDEYPDAHINPMTPANWNQRGRDWERLVHVEVFTPEGERVLQQDAGVRVFGSWSRAERVRSLRLIARREYSPHAGRFHYQFFPGDVIQDSFDFATPITAYNTLILRNGGNDRNHGIMRNELGSILARNAGFMDVTPARGAALFINGNYYGFMWLQTRFDAHYLQELYNTPTRDFDVVSRGEWWFRNTTEELEEELTYKNYFAWRDLTDDAEFALLNEIVDVENLLWYYAFQIFVANADWPHNNLRRWRYTGEPFPGMAPELDGRWRYAIFDLDQTFGLFGQNYRRPIFQHVLTQDNYAGQLIRTILQRQDMAELFTMMMNDIAANVVNYEIVSEIVDNLFEEAHNEMNHTIEAELLNHWVGWYSIGNYRNRTLDFAERRHIFINRSLAQKFDFDEDSEMFEVRVLGGEAIIGSVQATSSRYFAHLTIPVTPVLPPNTAFSHWEINGVNASTKTTKVTVADAVDGVVTLTLVTVPDLPPLMIHYASVTERGNGIGITNSSYEPLRTEGFFLSNRLDNLQRFPVPAITLEPGGTFYFAGRDSRGQEDIFRYRLDFNIRENRRVFLSDEDGNILDSVIINQDGVIFMVEAMQVKVHEAEREIRLAPISETKKGCPLRGMFADGKISSDKFIARKQEEKKLEQ